MRSTDSAVSISTVAVLAFALCGQLAAAEVDAKSPKGLLPSSNLMAVATASSKGSATVIEPRSPIQSGTVIVPEPPKAVPPSPEPQPREEKRRAIAAAFQRLLRGLAPIARAAIH
jgi:hypothetical protein